jgi:hypothetical protein
MRRERLADLQTGEGGQWAIHKISETQLPERIISEKINGPVAEFKKGIVPPAAEARDCFFVSRQFLLF